MLLAMVLSLSWSVPVFGAKSLPSARASEVEDHDDDDQHQGGAPGALVAEPGCRAGCTESR